MKFCVGDFVVIKAHGRSWRGLIVDIDPMHTMDVYGGDIPIEIPLGDLYLVLCGSDIFNVDGTEMRLVSRFREAVEP